MQDIYENVTCQGLRAAPRHPRAVLWMPDSPHKLLENPIYLTKYSEPPLLQPQNHIYKEIYTYIQISPLVSYLFH